MALSTSFNVAHESTSCTHDPVNSVSVKRRGKEIIVGLEARICPAVSYRVRQDDETAFLLDEEAGCWLCDGSIHTKVVTSSGDPVELSSKEARLLARALMRFADVLDAELETVPPSR